MHVHSLHIYPIKGGQRHTLTQSQVWNTGLAKDRQLMLVNEEGLFVSQRSLPEMALLKAEFQANMIRLSYQQHECLVDTSADLQQRTVQVWSDRLSVFDLGDQAAEGLTAMLGQRLRLVSLDTKNPRFAAPIFTEQKTVPYGFADGFPFLICSIESLADLNRRLHNKGELGVSMDRFRPNIVLSGGAAYIEDQIDILTIGQLKFKFCKPCTRCLVTTIDQSSGQSSREPLATLSSYRYDANYKGVTFGQNAYLLEGHGSLLEKGAAISYLKKTKN